MKISLIIATYNRAALLPRTINSIYAQSYQDWELIIVDDGSTDTTKAVVDALRVDDRLTYHCLPTNQGATAARNVGLDMATGDVIMVWDSDDTLYEHTLSRLSALFAAEPKAGIISAHCRQIEHGSVVPYTPLQSGYLSVASIVSRILPANTKIRAVKKDIFAQVRYQARNIDFTVNCYLARLAPWYHSCEELGDIYLESDGVSLTTERKRFKPERSVERVVPLETFLRDFKSELVHGVPYRYGALHYGLSIGQLLLGETKKARRSAWLAATYDYSLKHVGWLLCTYIPAASRLFRYYTGFSSGR